MREDTLRVSVVIPAFNEETAVGAEVENIRQDLQQSGIVHEIIVVDDGSHDRTADNAVAAKARVLRHLNNRGYGASLGCPSVIPPPPPAAHNAREGREQPVGRN